MTSLFDDNLDDQNEVKALTENLKTRFVKPDGSIDAEAMLTKMAHAERHIKTLEAENAEREKNSRVGATLDEILAKIEAKSNARVDEQPGSSAADRNSSSNNVDFDKILEDRFKDYELKKTRESNVQKVKSALEKEWGSNYQEMLHARAREIGEDPKFLARLAEERPNAFLNLVVKPKAPVQHADIFAPSSSVRTPTASTGGKTYSDFEKIRKENPSLYKSKQVQDELYRLTKEYAARGESFTET